MRSIRPFAVALSLVLGGLVVSPQPLSAADRGVADACPPDAPDAFVDDEASVHEANIDCIAYWGITKGVTATQYAPAAGTRRDQMATFVGNFMAVAGFDLAANPADAFTDDETSVHELNVNRLAAAGVVTGVGGGRYAPASLVRRDQMATFVANAVEAVIGSPIPAGVDMFVDDVGNPHEANIDKLAGIGVVVGKTATTYDPGSWVRRDQMASFLAKAADYLAEAGHWPMFGSNEAFRVVPRSAATLAVGEKRTYTAFVGDAESIGVGVVYCEDVTLSSTVSFASYTLGGYEGSLQAKDGVVTFDISGTEAGDCERPVVISDLDGDGLLDLDTGGRPTEPFGVGGSVSWTEPGSGDGGGGGGGDGGGGAAGNVTILDARAHDVGTAGLVDGGDVHQIVFSEPMPATADDPGMLYRLQDGDGTVVDLVLGTSAYGVLMPAGTYNGTAYPASQVMRVYLQNGFSAASVLVQSLSYPSTITYASPAWDVDLATSDRILEAAALSPVPAVDSVWPDMTSARASAATDTIVVTYAEAIVCDSSAGQFSYSDGNTTATTATGIVCSANTASLTFAADIVNGAEVGFGSLWYTDDNVLPDANDVRDLYGNQAPSPEGQGVVLEL